MGPSNYRKVKKRIRLFPESGAGFTLIEFLVTASIVIVLSTAVLFNFRTGEKQLALQRSANKVAQDIRRAQEMAMSARECPSSLCGGGGGVPEGYGIFFEISLNNEYLLYADKSPGNGFYDAADTDIETIFLEKGIIIQDINTPPKKVSINFGPPDPVTKIKYPYGGSGTEVNDAIITLAIETNLNQTKTVRVSRAGLIYVE